MFIDFYVCCVYGQWNTCSSTIKNTYVHTTMLLGKFNLSPITPISLKAVMRLQLLAGICTYNVCVHVCVYSMAHKHTHANTHSLDVHMYVRTYVCTYVRTTARNFLVHTILHFSQLNCNMCGKLTFFKDTNKQTNNQIKNK